MTKPMKPYRGIVFDFDGTLADSLGNGLLAFDYAISKVAETPKEPDEIKKYFGLGADRILTRVLAHEGKGKISFQHYLEYQRMVILYYLN